MFHFYIWEFNYWNALCSKDYSFPCLITLALLLKINIFRYVSLFLYSAFCFINVSVFLFPKQYCLEFSQRFFFFLKLSSFIESIKIFWTLSSILNFLFKNCFGCSGTFPYTLCNWALNFYKKREGFWLRFHWPYRSFWREFDRFFLPIPKYCMYFHLSSSSLTYRHNVL